MADQVPPLGHLPRIFERMNADHDVIPKACLEAACVLSGSEVRRRGRGGEGEGEREGGGGERGRERGRGKKERGNK